MLPTPEALLTVMAGLLLASVGAPMWSCLTVINGVGPRLSVVLRLSGAGLVALGAMICLTGLLFVR